MRPTPAQWRPAALSALWTLVVATFGLCAFSLWSSQPITAFSVLAALRYFLAALVLVWWTGVFARVTLGEGLPETSGTLRALRLTFPWLTALRLSLWFLNVLALSGEGASEASPVALTALLTVELGFILAKNAMYGTLARVAAAPLGNMGRLQLMSWLNAAAALNLAIGVVNVVPLAGMGGAPNLPTTIIFAMHALLDVAATLLAWKVVQLQKVPEAPM
ncbi:hypothetical protein [Deinococcus koreensis]|uniref:Uncharacterized protein n=1 Tax=Deinococcus koreensis TaxID=2054903 RepID=A0A2K3UUN2_9DEIO|nr:hypothetical protein [Deinococcus koreensis]PNY80239.1 hypothetical protein CVO96_01670 [Deinococcus koreensis]